MKLVKSLLLGSAAGLCAVAGAQAADLPVKKAAPVEYVRICTAYGAGFFYIPGTDTCLRVGGRARFEYEVRSKRSRGAYNNTTFAPILSSNDDVSGFRGLGRLNLDARTETAYGTLRAFVRFEIASRTGQGILRSGTTERYGTSFPGLGVDTVGRAQTNVNIDKAFVQFAGITAGRASSFFDFYAHDLEFVGLTPGSDVSATNLIAYTATLGGGLSATISMEDPIYRRSPVFNTGGLTSISGITGVINGGTLQPGSPGLIAAFPNGNPPAVSPVGVTFDPVTGLPTVARLLDVVQRNGVPDFVAAVRYDQPWGSVQLSGASHEIQVGQFDPNTVVSGNFAPNGTVAFPGGFLTPFGANTAGFGLGSPLAVAPVATNTALLTLGTATTNNALNVAAANAAVASAGPGRRPANEYGFAIQGGLKLNLPFIAPGDLLYLQAAYSEGALSYSGAVNATGYELTSNALTNRFATSHVDSAVDAFGRQHLTKSWSVVGALLHYWTPTVRSAVFGGYSQIDFDSILRTGFGPAGFFPIATVNGVTNFGNALNLALNPTLRDYNQVVVGSNNVWSPVKDLDIGLETVYQAQIIDKGRVVDTNKNLPIGAINNATGAVVPLGSANSTVIFKSIKTDDQFVARIRVQRDF